MHLALLGGAPPPLDGLVLVHAAGGQRRILRRQPAAESSVSARRRRPLRLRVRREPAALAFVPLGPDPGSLAPVPLVATRRRRVVPVRSHESPMRSGCRSQSLRDWPGGAVRAFRKQKTLHRFSLLSFRTNALRGYGRCCRRATLSGGFTCRANPSAAAHPSI